MYVHRYAHLYCKLDCPEAPLGKCSCSESTPLPVYIIYILYRALQAARLGGDRLVYDYIYVYDTNFVIYYTIGILYCPPPPLNSLSLKMWNISKKLKLI